jgi:hypothetical protein
MALVSRDTRTCRGLLESVTCPQSPADPLRRAALEELLGTPDLEGGLIQAEALYTT